MASSARRGSESSDHDTSTGQVEQMYTAHELHCLLKISVKTIYGLVQRGLIPYARFQRSVRFPRGKILEWIKRQTYQPKPPA